MDQSVKIIRNKVTGHEMKFIRTAEETNGERLEMEVTYPTHSNRPPMHYHPHQTEYFRLVSGEMTVVLGSEQRIIKPGDAFTVAPNLPHSMWNHGQQPAVMQWTITPALQTEQLFETLAVLANKGQTNADGVPRLLQLAQTMLYFSKEFRLSKPKFWIQRLVFMLLMPLACVLGYRGKV